MNKFFVADTPCLPCAKINLGLNVVEKRPDGYHNIETAFYAIPPDGRFRNKATGKR